MAKAAALTVGLLVALGGYGTSTAEAHRLHQGKGESETHYADRLVWHAKTGIRWIKTHAVKFRSYGRYRQALRNHRWLLKYGQSLQAKHRYVAPSIPPHYLDWMCIHRYEGAWNDPNPPYYGGLQMDWNFMSAYGGALLRSKGTADHWTPMEQMWTAERAFQSGRGFFPWPNTARMCGLI